MRKEKQKHFFHEKNKNIPSTYKREAKNISSYLHSFVKSLVGNTHNICAL